MRGLVAGWVVLAVAGWGVTRWLGEPAGTAGPGPVAPPASGAEPGPQPEPAYDCDETGRVAKQPSRMPDPSATGRPSDRSAVGDDGQALLSVMACDYVRFDD